MTDAVSIPWELVIPLIEPLEPADDKAGITSALDQLHAFASERLRELGLVLSDPSTLYATAAVLVLVGDCANNGRANGVLDDDTADEIRGLCRALGAALGASAPAEAFS